MTEPALLIIGHGTRDERGAAEFFTLVDRVRALAPHLRVAGGFLELSPPPISDAVASLAAQGARDITVVPLMLLAAGHVKDDIPAALAGQRLLHPGIRLRYARDVGIHSDVLAILDERLESVAGSDDAAGTAVLLCGRGSSDPDANADVCKIARLVFETRQYPFVETCFVGITRPTLPEGLDRCRRFGARRIVVAPHFLFTGVLLERIHALCDAFGRDHPDVDVCVADYLGPDKRIARIVLERYREAVDGDPRMNCDMCVHRVALPGFEAKVGAAAVPHFHPDDPLTHVRAHPDHELRA